MSERLDIDGVVRAIDGARESDGGLRWEDDAGVAREASLLRFGPHEWLARVGGRTIRLWTARTDEGTWVSWEGRTRLVRDVTREERRRAAGGGGASGDGRVTPPTPATVVRLFVEPGAVVEAGAALVVVSAMKMETTLVAPRAGTVRSVNTTVGAKVMPGDELVTLDSSPSQGGNG